MGPEILRGLAVNLLKKTINFFNGHSCIKISYDLITPSLHDASTELS